MNKSKCGFTLIELLVVIAIIAILAAILFPVFAKVREKARQTTCLNNEKQIGLGVLQYIQDYDETFPGSQFYGTTPATQYGWSSAIQPYIKNGTMANSAWGNGAAGGIFTCPSSPLPLYQSYALRSDVFPNMWPNGGWHAVSLAAIDSPSSKVMGFEMGDQGSYTGEFFMFPTNLWFWMSSADWGDMSKNHVPDNSYKYGDCDETGGKVNWWSGCAQFPRYRHTGNTNIPYLDGHVKSMRKGQLDWFRDIYNEQTDSNSFA